MSIDPDDLMSATTDEGLPIYDENGVDLTLIRQSLARTPTERLRALESFVRDLRRLQQLNGVDVD